MFKKFKTPDYCSVITEYQNLQQAVIRCIEAKGIIRLAEEQHKSVFINKIMFNEDIYTNCIQSVTAEICSRVSMTENCPTVPKEICNQLCYRIQRQNAVKTYRVLEHVTIPFEDILEFMKGNRT